MDEKNMQFANFNITFGENNSPMLEYFEDVVFPAFNCDYIRGKKGELPRTLNRYRKRHVLTCRFLYTMLESCTALCNFFLFLAMYGREAKLSENRSYGVTEENHEYCTSQCMLRNILKDDEKRRILITPKRRVHDGDHDGNYKVRNSPKDISNRAVSLVKWLPIINHLLAFYISDKSIFAELVSSV